LPKIEEIKKIFAADQDIRSFIKAGFIWAKHIIQQNQTDKYSNLFKPRVLVGIHHSDPQWKIALNGIGNIFQKYRTNIREQLFKGPHFGMPVMHNRFNTRLVGYEKGKFLSDRRGSPLIIKLIKSNGKYVPITIKMAGRLLPNDSVIVKEDRTGKKWRASKERQKENPTALDDFLRELTDQGFMEVPL